MNKKTFYILFCIFLISVFLHFFKINEAPPCLNADEVSYGYNAYSILKTGKDEYGTFMPLRLKSFGDYKLPLYSYLTIPSIAIFGLNDFAVRFPALLFSILFPLAFFFLLKEFFEKEKIAFIGSFLMAVSPWFNILGRHAHEGIVATFLLTVALVYLLRYFKNHHFKDLLFLSTFCFFALFSYHVSRVIVGFYFLVLLYDFFKNKKRNWIGIIIFLLPIIFFLFTEFLYSPARLGNLVFYNNAGFGLKNDEMLIEHGFKYFHNVYFQALNDLPKEYLKYLSPEFLTIRGDKDERFGFANISPITLVEYVFIFIGIYFMFKNKFKYRFFVILFLLISPLPASLAWQDYSLKRAFYMIVPLLMIISYGIYYFYLDFKDSKYGKFIFISIFFSFLFFLSNTWDFYFFHYPKRAVVVRAWQCGYKELVNYTKENYFNFDQFMITKRNGQPYIYYLFYLAYSPDKYQKQAKLSPPDDFGYGQVEGFDKFIFDTKLDKLLPKTSYALWSDDFELHDFLKKEKARSIKIRTEDMFWIYENK